MLESAVVKLLWELARGRGAQQLPGPDDNLRTLAPAIVAAIFHETLLPNLTLFQLAVDPPKVWEGENRQIGAPRHPTFTDNPSSRKSGFKA